MKKVLLIGFFTVFLLQTQIYMPEILAQDIGDSNSLVCGEKQMIVQEFIENSGVYKNHGELVSEVVYMLNQFKHNGEITTACATCIMKQFALGVPVEEQEFCGPDPTHVEACCFPTDNSCVDYTPDDCLARDGVPQGPESQCLKPYCLSPCVDNVECQNTEHCRKEVGQCGSTGTCVDKPTDCPQIYDPVCGCDGNTYPNECQAAIVGISVNYPGGCGDSVP